MNSQTLIAQAENDLLHTYNRFPIILDHGCGVHLFDLEGKRYLDFMSGIAVFAFGYGNEHFEQAIADQTKKLLHTSNYFYNEPAIRAAHRLKKLTGLDRVFFTNSGAEAVEGALKAAMKVAYTRDKEAGRTLSANSHSIVALKHSFHGRTYGALSVTGNDAYRMPFGPMVANVRFAQMNNFESVLEAVGDDTCAIILETVQGEGGIIPAKKSFLKEVRSLCDERKILLILDEIQCGMGRTGTMYAYEQYGIKPDILTLAKALGCGIPVGAFLMTEQAAQQSLVPGDHGTTYGGNPIAAAAINAVLDEFENRDVLENVHAQGAYLKEQLLALKEYYPCIIETRGLGLMQGLVFNKPVSGIIKEAQKRGLLLINAGTHIIRFVPPLIIEKEHIDEMTAILKESIEADEHEH